MILVEELRALAAVVEDPVQSAKLEQYCHDEVGRLVFEKVEEKATWCLHDPKHDENDLQVLNVMLLLHILSAEDVRWTRPCVVDQAH